MKTIPCSFGFLCLVKFPWEDALPPYKNQSLITYTRESPGLRLASSQNDLGLLLHQESNSERLSNKGPFELRSFVLGLLCHRVDWNFVIVSPLCIGSSLDFFDRLFAFVFLWVVFTCVLIWL